MVRKKFVGAYIMICDMYILCDIYNIQYALYIVISIVYSVYWLKYSQSNFIVKTHVKFVYYTSVNRIFHEY